VESPVGEVEVEAVARALGGAPLLVNLGGGGKTPMLPAARLETLGFRVAIYPGDLQKTAIRAMREVAATLRREGTTVPVADRMVSSRIGLSSWVSPGSGRWRSDTGRPEGAVGRVDDRLDRESSCRLFEASYNERNERPPNVR
jgi:hypothetical protein